MNKRIKIKVPCDTDYENSYETRKITVTQNDVLENIRDVLGGFKCIFYIDEDGDMICCYLGN